MGTVTVGQVQGGELEGERKGAQLNRREGESKDGQKEKGETVGKDTERNRKEPFNNMT